ncbi:MAG: GAF domain-containing protein, partial [Betaproteobacteria bacterium]
MAKFGTLDEVLHGLIEMTVAELGAERGSLFLNDPASGELYSRVVKGRLRRELRLLNNTGIAGHVFTSGEPLIVHDAYTDARFNKAIDEQTGFKTRSILAVPVRTVTGEIIGVVEALNKKKGRFTRRDLELLEAMTAQGALALQGAQVI